jgi:hypothetical protein
MKNTILLLSAIFLGSHSLSAQVYVEAPVTISATVTTTLDPIYTSTSASVSTVVTKISNANLLAECVRRNIISSTSGWSIVVYYDSVMDGIYTKSDPVFRLRHTDGRVASLDPVIQIDPVASSASGKAKISGTKVSGSLSRVSIYVLTINYQDYSAVCFGSIPFTLAISGTTSESYGTCGKVSATLSGYLTGDYESTIAFSISANGFKRK